MQPNTNDSQFSCIFISICTNLTMGEVKTLLNVMRRKCLALLHILQSHFHPWRKSFDFLLFQIFGL